MRLLYVTEGVPHVTAGAGDGSVMIPYQVIAHLPEHVRVHLLTWDHGRPVPDAVRDRCDAVTLLPPLHHRAARAAALVTPLSRGALERCTPAALAAVRALHRDVTLLHGPHSVPLAAACRGPVAAQLVDPWSHRLEMEFGTRPTSPEVRWDLVTSRFLERHLPRRVAWATVGRADAARLQRVSGRPVRAVPNGVQVEAAEGQLPEHLTVCFTGSLDYAPNVESAQRLVREVAPALWRREPRARVVLAGRNPAPEVLALAGDRVEVRGDVPSLSEVYAGCHVAVFPDRRGAGVRNSVSEALAAGVPVVASAVAAREQPRGERLVVVDAAEGFAEAVAGAVTEAAAWPRPGAAGGWRTWRDAAQDYLALCDSAVALRPPRP